MVNFGSMRYVIEVQQPNVVKDEFGSVVESFVTILNLRASIKYSSGTKEVNNEEIFTSQMVVFTIHYREISPVMRIVFKGKNYRILFIDELGFKEGLSITCELINE